jgi:hypothetical protein
MVSYASQNLTLGSGGYIAMVAPGAGITGIVGVYGSEWISSNTVVATGTAGQFDVFVNQASAHLAIDILGYFRAPSGIPAGTVTNVATGTGLTGGPITTSGTINLAATQLLPTTACSNTQVAKWNGSAWACAADNDTNSGGTVTGVTASAPLASSGGTAPNITLTGTVPVANGGTGATTLAANGVLIGQGTAAVGTAVGVAGQVLAGTAGAPAWTGSPSLSGNLALVSSTATTGNILKGGAPFIHNFGTDNTFVGLGAGNLNPTMTGSNNTASGQGALGGNTTGGSNTASGRSALQINTTGTSNTASGSFALFGNTIGSANTASGFQANGNNTTGISNTANGVDTLLSNTTGNENTAVGRGALLSNTTGNFNTAIGYFANVSSGALTNATAIGNGAVVNANNKIRLGNASVTVIEGQVAYTFPSDRNQKENLRPVDAEKVLEKLRAMSITSWNYIGHDPKAFRHYGPMAQDFHAAFGHDEVGAFGTDTTINVGDIAGILMVAVQGLDSQVQKDRHTIEAQAAEIVGLKAAAARTTAAQTAEIAGLRAAVAEVADLKRQMAHMVRLLDQRGTGTVTAGLLK